jgi:hypothetical protein
MQTHIDDIPDRMGIAVTIIIPRLTAANIHVLVGN